MRALELQPGMGEAEENLKRPEEALELSQQFPLRLMLARIPWLASC